ncbi:MAG TPA: basic amino acid ABC transporter substrate-binding protein, partial [Verrucomicrobiota bacterium]|nr:basic amino acid ABC transporter substrate-binding protein [Verrucomicrobiota bacterium]
MIVSYAGQVVPLLTLTGGLDAPPLAQGDIFDIAPTGAVAAISSVPGGQSALRINGQELRVLPSSEFGLNTNLRYADVEWAPDGSRLAFHVNATNPDDPTAIDSGVWVFRPGEDRAHQVFRTGFEGRVAQAHEQRAATAIDWSPDGSALIIRVTTPRGFANVVTPASHDVNLAPEGGFIESLPFADATWAANSRDVIVSGAPWGGGPEVVGRVDVATGQYTEYLNQQATGLFMRAAFEVAPGQIAFLGGPSPDGFALYTVPAEPGATPQPVSGTIPGQVQHAEWSRERRAALVTVQSPTGPRLWIVRLDGTTQDITPPSGVFTGAQWDDISAISIGYGAGAPEEGEDTEVGMESELGVVTVGMNAEYPPFEFVDEEGNIVGFDVDLMNAIAAEAGFDIELVNTRWDGIFVALQSGEFDAVASAATITEEREEIVDFSNPYFNAGQMIAVREVDAADISTPDDLAGLRVGVQSGTTGDIWASENIPGVEMVRYDEVTLAFQALAAGDIDAVFNDGPVSAEIITQNPEMGVVLVGEPATEELYGVAVQPDLPELLDAVNEGLQAIIDNGTYRDIFMEWFGTEPPEMFQPADMPSATYTSTITPTPEFLCVVVPRHTASVRSQPST